MNSVISVFHSGNSELGMEPAFFEFVGVVDVPRCLKELDNGADAVFHFMQNGHPNGVKSSYKPGMVKQILPNVIAIFLASKKTNPSSTRKSLFSDEAILQYKSSFLALEYKNEWLQFSNFEQIVSFYSNKKDEQKSDF
jgi:hypothetical protein